MLTQEEEQCRKEQTEQECVNNRLRFRLSDERNIQHPAPIDQDQNEVLPP